MDSERDNCEFTTTRKCRCINSSTVGEGTNATLVGTQW